MAHTQLEADYIVIGAGAMGMAFVDTMLTKPGGHWNDAYPFVTLHQPSAYYGVSSKELSKSHIDETGFNKGLEDLATGAEILAYFDDVMRRRFLASGRVRYLPMHEYHWESGAAKPILGGDPVELKATKKLVDSTWLKTTVPSTHVPNFQIAPEATLRPLNDLPKLTHSNFSDYVVCGGGKTGMDAVLWLLQNGCDPDRIGWIMPRDGWLMDRANTQTQDQFFFDTMGNQANQMEAIAASTSIDDLFDRLETAGCLVRLDQSVTPKMFHGATVSQEELTQLRRVKNVIRKGRIQRIDETEIVLDGGAVPTSGSTLHVDCTACAVGNSEPAPVFAGDTIRLQTVRTVQPVFSASIIAYVEAHYDDEAKKNELCTLVPLPNHATDWIPIQAAAMMNQFIWSQDKVLRNWISGNRLDGYSRMVMGIDKDDTEKRAVMQRLRDASMGVAHRLR